MQESLSKLLGNLLIELGNRFKAGNCEMTEEEQLDLLDVITHKALSKEQACKFLNVRHTRFGELIATGVIPQGRKRVGHPGKIWYENELRRALRKKRKEN